METVLTVRRHSKAGRGFSLLEILVVLGVVSLLLVLTVPSAVSLTPVRKTALHEVKGFLEFARSQAIARDREVYVAFADRNYPGERSPYRAYTAYVAVGDEKDGSIDSRDLARISEWRTLPEGAVFIGGEELETVAGASLRTVLDSSFTRGFPIKLAGGANGSATLPFLLFSPSGRVLVPSYFDADALHVGIGEGYFDRASGRGPTGLGPTGPGPTGPGPTGPGPTGPGPIVTARRPGLHGTGEYAQADCLAIEYYTGRTRAITD